MAAFTHEAEEEVLGAHVAVTELARFIDRELDDLLRAWAQRNLTRRERGVAPADDLLDARAQVGQGDAERVQGLRGYAFALTRQAQQEMLGADVVVVEADRLVLREGEHALGAVVEAIERSHRDREYGLLVR